MKIELRIQTDRQSDFLSSWSEPKMISNQINPADLGLHTHKYKGMHGMGTGNGQRFGIQTHASLACINWDLGHLILRFIYSANSVDGSDLAKRLR